MSITPSLRFSCPHCDQHIECDVTWGGQSLACPSCGQTLAVPGTPPPAVALAPVPPVVPRPARSLAREAEPRRPAGASGRQAEWANFSLVAPIMMWVLAFVFQSAPAGVRGMLGLVWLGVIPVALIGGLRAYRALRPARAKGWGRALAGILLNTFCLLMMLIVAAGLLLR